MATISAAAQATLAKRLDDITKDGDTIPGVVFCAVNKEGNLVFKHAAGKRGVGLNEPMTLDSIFWIASCTKMITGIACMQLVEQGKLDLDSVERCYELCPELKEVKVLERKAGGGFELVDKKRDITLRMLLTHTAGFGYTFFNEKLRDYGKPIGIEDLTGVHRDYLKQPLVNQPGSRWEYGINIDWAGIMAMRATGLSLDEYFKKNIFEPLGVKNISFFPTEEMKQNIAYMHHRGEDGKLEIIDHPHHRPLAVETPEEVKATFNAGGAGCFAQPSEYCKIISMYLNDGVSPTTGKRLLKKETIDEMFTNQISEFPDFGRVLIPASKPYLTNALPALYPQEGPQGWGLTFFSHLSDGLTGRAAGTGWWAGIANLFWWADRKKGLGGMITTQILPFGDPNVLGLWGEIEAGLYAGMS